MIVAQNSLVISSFEKEYKILVSVYTGRVNVQLGIEQAENLQVFYKTNEVKGMLFDLSKLYGSFAKILDYYKASYPSAIENGLTCMAYVISDDIITKNLVSKLQAMGASFSVKTAVFSNQKEAEEWLKSNLEIL